MSLLRYVGNFGVLCESQTPVCLSNITTPLGRQSVENSRNRALLQDDIFLTSKAKKWNNPASHLYCGQMMQEQHTDLEVDRYKACIQSLQSTTNNRKLWISVLIQHCAEKERHTSFNTSPFCRRSQEEVSGCSLECQIYCWLSFCWVPILWFPHPCTDMTNPHHLLWATCIKYT